MSGSISNTAGWGLVIVGRLGPDTSASKMPTLAPIWASVYARFTATVDLPTPPLQEATATMWRTPRRPGGAAACARASARAQGQSTGAGRGQPHTWQRDGRGGGHRHSHLGHPRQRAHLSPGLPVEFVLDGARLAGGAQQGRVSGGGVASPAPLLAPARPRAGVVSSSVNDTRPAAGSTDSSLTKPQATMSCPKSGSWMRRSASYLRPPSAGEGAGDGRDAARVAAAMGAHTAASATSTVSGGVAATAEAARGGLARGLHDPAARGLQPPSARPGTRAVRLCI